MPFVVVPMIRSSLLNGQQNGRLDPDIMRTVPAARGTVTLIHPAARAWAAMHAAAAEAGIPLGSVGSYRTYAVQVELFTQRYTTRYLRGRPYKVWRGQRWYQKPGTAVTAVPGTSNHGWGSAVDVADAYGSRLTWLLRNEVRFGYSHEVQSESWHVRYFAGDRIIPPAVLAYEAGTTPQPPQDWFDMATETDLRRIVREEIDAHERWLQFELGTNDSGPRDDSLYGLIRANASTIQRNLAVLIRQLAQALGHPLP